MANREGIVFKSAPERSASNVREASPTAEDVSRVDVHETNFVQSLNVINEGIRSLKEVHYPSFGVSRPSTLRSLSLHSNQVSSLEGLASMTALTNLTLSSNELDGAAIRSCAPHMGALSCLESLDLSCNRIDTLLGLPFLPRLSRLLVAYNRLISLDGVQALASSLTFLDVRDNRIAGPADAHTPHLAALGRLKTLLFMSPGGGQRNPVCSCPDYRVKLITAAPSLQVLDGTPANSLEIPPESPDPTTRSPDRDAKGVSNAMQEEITAAARPRSGRPCLVSGEGPGRVHGGSTRGRKEALVDAMPEEVPTPRFDAVAGRFLRGRQRRQGREGKYEYSERCFEDGTLGESDDWSSSEYGADRHGVVGPGVRRSENKVGHRVGGIRERVRWESESRRTDDGFMEGGEAFREEDDVAEDQRLLGRLRSVAQEARLEVMDSRIRDFHNAQTRDAAEARKVAAAAAATMAARRPGVAIAGKTTQQKGVRHDISQVGSGNPWAQSASGRGVTRSGGSGRGCGVAGLSRQGSRPNAPGPHRPWHDAAASNVSALPRGMAHICDADASGTLDPSRRAATDDRTGKSCSYCSAAEGSVQGLGRRLVEGDWVGAGAARRNDPRHSDMGRLVSAQNSKVTKSVSADASTQTTRGITILSGRPTGVARPRSLIVGDPDMAASPARRGVVAAAAVMGAAAAALSVLNRKRLAIGFLRWARYTDHVKVEAVTAASDLALAEARAGAERERHSWELLEKSLEASAATREREAREAAEESNREKLQTATTACRAAEETASVLRRQLAQSESDRASSLAQEQQAQTGRKQAEAEVARLRAEAEATSAALTARAERLEEQLRGKARVEEEAEEECRRVRGLLRETESRCRGLQDEIEESRARERRIIEDAEDARRRAAAEAERKLAAAVEAEREHCLALKHKLEGAEAAARMTTACAREAEEGQARGRRAVAELAELARQQKAALQLCRGEVSAARAERAEAQRAAEKNKAEAARLTTEIQEQRKILEARDEEIAALRRSRRQKEERLQAERERSEAFKEKVKEFEAKLEVSLRDQGDLRTALMVKDKVLEDREKFVKELRDREEDALTEARSWRDRLEAQQSDADLQLDAARDEISELQAQVVELSGAEEQLRGVFKELQRYRKSGADEGLEDHREGVHSREKGSRRKDVIEGLDAVSAVTAAAKVVEKELRDQLEAKDEALRYVEKELLSMKSLFEGKEASLREELSGELEREAQEAREWKRRAEEAAREKAAAEESVREQVSIVTALRSSIWTGEQRTRELEQTLRALLNKYEQEQRRTLNLSKIAALFKQLQQEEAVEGDGDKQGFQTVSNGPMHGGPSLDISDTSGARGGGSGGKVPDKIDP